jgi:uncharacterized protein YneF (UPF0154 family)
MDPFALLFLAILFGLLGGMFYRSWKADRAYHNNPKIRGHGPS